MTPTEPLALHHSWPLYERDARFDLGLLHDGKPVGSRPSDRVGRWGCDLATQKLTWSPAIHALFGLDTAATPAREEVLRMYRPDSLGPMERLRAYAIRHRRGFTLDTEIATPAGVRRWMRIVATPVCRDDRVVRLEGTKHDVTAVYRR